MGNKTPAHPLLQGAAPSLPHLQTGVEPADLKTSGNFPKQGNRDLFWAQISAQISAHPRVSDFAQCWF